MEDKVITEAVDGEVIDYDWQDEETLFVYVKDEDEQMWREKFTFDGREPYKGSEEDFVDVH